MSIHVYKRTVNPSAAPTAPGQHWINTSTGDQWLSNGTASVANWIKQVTADTGITQLTGDVTTASGSGSQAATLATVNSNVGSFTNASVTVNAKGLVTAASNGTAPVTSVTGTAPVVSSGGTTPAISMAAATTSVSGYLSSTDWNTFNGKQAALGFTPENVANKATDGTLAANSDTNYPSQKAVKTYVDTQNTPIASAISAAAIDWSLTKKTGGIYTKTLGANTTFTFSNQAAAQTIVVILTNTASNWTVTWPTVKWSGGTTPVMTIGAKSDVYTFVYDGTNVYGSVVQNF
jgi:hypothetical protein